MAATDISRHTLSVLVEDIDGIISRVAAMFTRRQRKLPVSTASPLWWTLMRKRSSRSLSN